MGKIKRAILGYKKIFIFVCLMFSVSNIFAVGHQIVFEQKASTNFKTFRYEGDLGYYFSILNEPELSVFNGGRFLSVFANAAYSFDFGKDIISKNARFDLGLDMWFMPIFGVFTNRVGVFYSPTDFVDNRFGVFYDVLVHFDLWQSGNPPSELGFGWDNNFSLGAKCGLRFNFYPLNKNQLPEINLYLAATVTFNFKSKGSFAVNYSAVEQKTDEQQFGEELSEWTEER